MRTFAVGIVAVACCLLAPPAHAQKATEKYIPIGLSPGLSGTKTTIGTIASVKTATKEIVLTEKSGAATIRVTERTHVWLDRSKLRRPNRDGTLADCQAPRRIEVRYVDDDAERGVAEWIKVEILEE